MRPGQQRPTEPWFGNHLDSATTSLVTFQNRDYRYIWKTTAMKQTHSISKIPEFSTLTREQGSVIIAPDRNALVVARAGSGKTKVAMAYCAARPQHRGLYIAFGKPTQIEAHDRLSKLQVKTEARTGHSLAYQSFGAALDRAGKLAGNASLRTATTAQLLKVNYGLAKAVNETVRRYMSSADATLGEQHLPSEEEFTIIRYASAQVLGNAQHMWDRLVDVKDTDTRAVPDVYLKQWVNSAPKLDYDFILFDECQDANPIMSHLVRMQDQCTRIYIGDPHQAIYGFRGAFDAMDDIQVDRTHHLTASFRFGPNIGLLASTFLKHWKGEQLPIRGLGAGGRILPTDQRAYLGRTVAGLIAKGFELHGKGNRLHWVKGFEDYRVAPILEAFRLFKGESSASFQDPVLKLMRSWSELADYVEETRDGEAGPVYKLVKQYGDEIPHIIETLKRDQVRNSHDAPIVLTTAHKSKGLEWPVVHLINDHFSMKDPQDGTKWMHPKRVDQQELNLTYVELTRARKAVAPTPEIVEWFRQQPATKHLFPEPAPRPQTDQEVQARQAAAESDIPRAA